MTGAGIVSSSAHSVAKVATPMARRYLAQLCKHFQHKCAVTLEDSRGRITFTAGDCLLAADGDTLTLALDAPDEASLTQLQDVVDRHLVRFAFRETLRINWQAA